MKWLRLKLTPEIERKLLRAADEHKVSVTTLAKIILKNALKDIPS